MRTDILIIGQGLSGTFLSHWLEKEDLSFVVIDEERPFTPSKAAAGIINPVTGRRIVKTWMIDELLPFALDAYREINAALNISCLTTTEMIEFFPTAQMRNAFVERLASREEASAYLQLPGREGTLPVEEGTLPPQTRALPLQAGTKQPGVKPGVRPGENAWAEYFRYDLGYGIITPCALVDLSSLLTAFRKNVRDRGLLREERFDPAGLQTPGDGVSPIRYKDIEADRIIFCDGAGSFDSPYFRNLPFAPNKGEALILEIDGLPPGTPIFKKGMVLAPWRERLYWVGSSYEWSFTNEQPTEVFRRRSEAALHEWLKVPFRVVDHITSVRPATLERRPFVGFHPQYQQVGILNGMGTKGCSLAPYFAKQLAAHIKTGEPIQSDVDVKRFAKILSR